MRTQALFSMAITKAPASNPRAARIAGALLAAASLLPFTHVEARTLTLEQRVAAQRAIEQVYWNHRIWPKQNPGAKPPLSAVISDAQIRAKVEDCLGKSQALETEWQRPITHEQLQAEIDRMAANTQSPDVLQELFDALGDDPCLIAETLARPNLAEARIRTAYANDTRFRGEPSASFDAWWAKQRASTPFSAGSGEEPYRVPTITTSSCNNDTWGAAPSTSGNVPTATGYFASVWTGAEMIIWGGFDGTISTSVNTGGRYDPATDTWGAPTSTSGNVPSARTGPAAVWTGTEMIVWGGYNGAFLNTGGRYDPATNTWGASTSTSGNVPSARYDHSAVWTGAEMIVWGGFNNGVELNTGGRYDPATDTWGTPTSTSGNVPSGRDGHAAVWTGSEMIVWGGTDTNSQSGLNTGGRYDPSSDTWGAPTTTIGTTTPRISPGAAWTGADIIIWGGYTGGAHGSSLNTGARYDPSTDSWGAPTSTVGAPAPQSDPAVVWTGNEMIVWGRPGLNNAGRYCAGILAVEPPPVARPSSFELFAPLPNPTSNASTFSFTLPEAARVRAEIFDTAGRRIARLVNEQRMEAGGHSLVWDGRGRSGARLESGVYYVRVSAGPHWAGRMLVLLSP
jgi:hypothetical protein